MGARERVRRARRCGRARRLPREAEAVGDRLLALSAHGVGFVDGGSDGEGPWLLRRAAPSLLEQLASGPRA
ncbi:MAG: hypothetical protein WKG00_19370 [Polyangiaceae bacterium]